MFCTISRALHMVMCTRDVVVVVIVVIVVDVVLIIPRCDVCFVFNGI